MNRSSTRLPVRRTRVVTAGSLSPAERAELTERALAIVGQTFHGTDPVRFAERALYRSPEARIALFYGASGELAGFSSAGVVKIWSGGVEHSVFDAGVFFDLRYDGGRAATRFGLMEALRVRLANPRVRLWFLSETTSAAPYCLAARTVPEIYPHPDRETPAEVDALVRAFAAIREMKPVGDDPWVIHNAHGARLADAERVRAASRLRDDPVAAYFVRRNPTFEEGHRMLIAVPLHFRNVLSGLLSPLRAAAARAVTARTRDMGRSPIEDQ